jgi:lipopolysaccharide transport system ATP-binding protein
MPTSIKVENLSKIYRLGQIGTGTISKDMERWFRMNVLGQDDPYLKIGQSNDRTQKGDNDVVYSLQDINFEIEQGDAVGIIGRNGAGKSTLLKILSRVTAPTTGRIQVKGRVASLLEVGTGFHPELTGRENIFLNGAILGMRKKEIARKLDEIIDFSGVERYIDTPVKRYSSGMYVRLAFAVAAHLESEILIVDEVLAVGDAEFQKKCLGKMGDVSKGEGRTVLFVSHNMQAIRKITSKSILLKNGTVEVDGETSTVIDKYLSISNSRHYLRENIPTNKSIIQEISILNDNDRHDINEDIYLNVVYICNVEDQILSLSLALFDVEQNYILNSPSGTTENIWSGHKHKIGKYKATVCLKGGLLNQGIFNPVIVLVENNNKVIDEIKDEIFIEFYDKQIELGYTGFWGGVVRPKLNWTIDAC